MRQSLKREGLDYANALQQSLESVGMHKPIIDIQDTTSGAIKRVKVDTEEHPSTGARFNLVTNPYGPQVNTRAEPYLTRWNTAGLQATRFIEDLHAVIRRFVVLPTAINAHRLPKILRDLHDELRPYFYETTEDDGHGTVRAQHFLLGPDASLLHVFQEGVVAIRNIDLFNHAHLDNYPIPMANAPPVAPIAGGGNAAGAGGGGGGGAGGGGGNAAGAGNNDQDTPERRKSRSDYRVIAAKLAIEEYVSTRMHSYRFARRVSGSILNPHLVNLTSDARIIERIYEFWKFISAPFRERQIDYNVVVEDWDIAQYELSINRMDAFLEHEYEGGLNIQGQVQMLNEDRVNPGAVCDRLFTPILVSCKERAWQELKTLLYYSLNLDRNSTGARNAARWVGDRDTPPNINFVLLYTYNGLSVFNEFAVLTGIFINITNGERVKSRYEMADNKFDLTYATNALKNKLIEMKFTFNR